LRIVAASNDRDPAQVQFFSTDAGLTWQAQSLPTQPGDARQADPAVDWTSDGTAWTMTIGVGTDTTLRLRRYSSPPANFGTTWTFDITGPTTQTGVDREIMWVDHSPTSPFRDQIYVTYHIGAVAWVVRRATGAGAAWQTPVQVSFGETTGTPIGGDITTNNVGDVFVFWPDTGGSGRIRVRKSVDGGAAFSAPVVIGTIFASSRILSIPAAPFPPRGVRVYVSGAAFRAGARDLVYAVWADLSGDPGCTTGNGPGTSVTSSCKTRIWFTRSTNGGTTWAPPQMLNNQASLNDQFHPAICVDETNSDLVVVYQDTVSDSGRAKSDVWMQVSRDDGLTFSAATKLTSAQTDETAVGADNGTAGNQYGDYNSLSGHAGRFFPSWTDRRSGGAEEIWSTVVWTQVPLAAPHTALTSWNDGAYQHVAYLGQDTHLHELYFEIGMGPWKHSDLSDLTGAPAAAPSGGLTSWEDNGTFQHVVCLTSPGALHELFFEIGVGPWKPTDLNNAAGPAATLAAPDSALTSWSDGAYQHVAYLTPDGHVHELFFEIEVGPWKHTDLMIAVPAAPPAAAGSALTSWWGGGYQHVAYVGGDSHVHELFFEIGVGPWKPSDLHDEAGPGVTRAVGHALTSWSDETSQHVAYLDPIGRVHELFFEIGVGPWKHTDLNNAVGPAAPLAAPNSALTSWSDGAYQHVAYLTPDGHVHELFLEIGAGPWKHTDLMIAVPAAPPAAAGSALTSWWGGGYQHVGYVGGDSHVHEFFFEIGAGPWKHTDLMTVANP
jgi:hypothetical protein